eukprot:7630356-Pyramimonas_sp.AAC.1
MWIGDVGGLRSVHPPIVNAAAPMGSLKHGPSTLVVQAPGPIFEKAAVAHDRAVSAALSASVGVVSGSRAEG